MLCDSKVNRFAEPSCAPICLSSASALGSIAGGGSADRAGVRQASAVIRPSRRVLGFIAMSLICESFVNERGRRRAAFVGDQADPVCREALGKDIGFFLTRR